MKSVILGDREFHSIELAQWLKTEGKSRKKALYFAFRQKKDTYIKIGRAKEHPLKNISLQPGIKIFFTGVKITKRFMIW